MLTGNTVPEGTEFDYPVNEYRYFYFAERFGWTPDQVDQQPAVLLDWLQAIGGVVDEIKTESLK